MEIVPASPVVWPLIVELFAAGGDPRWCWCQWWRKRNANWTNATAEANRADLERVVRRDGHNPLGAPSEVCVQRDERVGLELRQGEVLGLEGRRPAEPLRDVPRASPEHAVAEEADRHPSDPVELVTRATGGEVAPLDGLVERGEHL